MLPNIYPLHPKTERPVITRQEAEVLYSGRQYPFTVQSEGENHVPSGMVGDYRLSPQRARLLPVEVRDGTALVYLYDAEVCLASPVWQAVGAVGEGYRITANRLTLSGNEVVGPELVQQQQHTLLTMQPVFQLHYNTEAYAAELGVVHLVQSQRFVNLENGAQRMLLETTDPVLYLPGPDTSDAVQCITPGQAHGRYEDYRYQLSLEQAIPERLDGQAVESVTVLEQYHSYFMQRECSDDTAPVIWTPALAPITWGWSIRVGRRADNEWGIVRRKLILPTVGHDGLEFPTWEENQLALMQAIEA